jgi:hypothetical protein
MLDRRSESDEAQQSFEFLYARLRSSARPGKPLKAAVPLRFSFLLVS